MILYICRMSSQIPLFEMDATEKSAFQQAKNPDNLPFLVILQKTDYKKKQTPLEKEQKKYNKLIKELHDYETEFKARALKEEQERILYQKLYTPELIKLAAIKLDLLLKAEKIFESNKFTKKQQLNFCLLMQTYAEDVIQINEEIALLAYKYSQLGLQLMSPKERKKIAEDLTEEDFWEEDFWEEGLEDMYDEPSTHNKKTKSQKEKLETNNIDMEAVSLNDLYKSLAKELHPDLEKDAHIQSIKLGLMQELSEAKTQKDLFAMMRIQQKASAYLSGEGQKNIFTIERLKAYNTILKEKVKDYETQFSFNLFDSFFSETNNLRSRKKETSVEEKIQLAVKQVKQVVKSVKNDFSFIRDADSLLEFMDFRLFD
jgi:hypothetical protein